MKFSLIVATVHRTEPLVRLLASLAGQTCRDFELILVDQNPDDRVKVLADAWSGRMTILHVRSEKGLSRARNLGIVAAAGEIVAFPDDDCWYAPETLQTVDTWFAVHPEFGFLSTSATDEDGQLAAGRWLPASAEITRSNVFRTHISFSLFFRKSAILAAGGFDELLGLGSGSKFGSGEETDFVLRVMSFGNRGWYERSLAVFHPARLPDSSPTAQKQALSYGLGFGYVLRRHKFSVLTVLYLCLRPAGGWILSVLIFRPIARVYLATLRGRLDGYFSSQARTSMALPTNQRL